MTQPTVSKH